MLFVETGLNHLTGPASKIPPGGAAASSNIPPPGAQAGAPVGTRDPADGGDATAGGSSLATAL